MNMKMKKPSKKYKTRDRRVGKNELESINQIRKRAGLRPIVLKKHSEKQKLKKPRPCH